MPEFLNMNAKIFNNLKDNTMNNKLTPHKHAQVIKDWADGYEIEYRAVRGTWTPAEAPCWSLSLEYRRKPEIPKSGLTDEQLRYVAVHCDFSVNGYEPPLQWRAIADAAVSHFIQIDMNTYLATLKGSNET